MPKNGGTYLFRYTTFILFVCMRHPSEKIGAALDFQINKDPIIIDFWSFVTNFLNQNHKINDFQVFNSPDQFSQLPLVLES